MINNQVLDYQKYFVLKDIKNNLKLIFDTILI